MCFYTEDRVWFTFLFLFEEDVVDFVKDNLEKFVFNKIECKLSDIFMFQVKHQLEIVAFDPEKGLFLFDVENRILIRLKHNKRSQKRPIKCSLNEGKLELDLNKL